MLVIFENADGRDEVYSIQLEAGYSNIEAWVDFKREDTSCYTTNPPTANAANQPPYFTKPGSNSP